MRYQLNHSALRCKCDRTVHQINASTLVVREVPKPLQLATSMMDAFLDRDMRFKRYTSNTQSASFLNLVCAFMYCVTRHVSGETPVNLLKLAQSVSQSTVKHYIFGFANVISRLSITRLCRCCAFRTSLSKAHRCDPRSTRFVRWPPTGAIHLHVAEQR